MSLKELFAYAKKLDLLVVETDDLPRKVQGLFFPSVKPKIIAVKESLSEIEKRWVLAHEIGHFLDLSAEGMFALDDLCPSGPEQRADCYALELLTTKDERADAYTESQGCPRKMCALLNLPFVVGDRVFSRGVMSPEKRED